MFRWFADEWTRGGMAGVVKVIVAGLVLIAVPFLLWGAGRTAWRLVRCGPRATFENGIDPGIAYLLAILTLAAVAVMFFVFPLGTSAFW